jgi:hypothetical protein
MTHQLNNGAFYGFLFTDLQSIVKEHFIEIKDGAILKTMDSFSSKKLWKNKIRRPL